MVLLSLVETHKLVDSLFEVDQPLIGTDLLLELELVPLFGDLFGMEVKGECFEEVGGIDVAKAHGVEVFQLFPDGCQQLACNVHFPF